MPRKTPHASEPDLSVLVKEVLQVTGDLLSQHAELLRGEVQQELQRMKSAAASAGLGVGLLAAGGGLSTLMLVHGLSRVTGLPLWACYGLVGGLACTAGIRLLEAGRHQAASVKLVPEQTVEALRENLTWLKEQASPAAK